MKSGTSWSFRGLDDEAREAAVEAARQAGLPVNEWLNQTIAERAAAERVTPQFHDDDESDDQLRAVAESVANLTRRIRAMDQNSRAAISGLKGRLDEIEGNLGKVPDSAGVDDRRARSLQGVSAMVDQLAREIDNADETARSTIEGLRARVGAAGRREPAPPPRDPNDQIAIAIRALDQRIAAMAERLKRPVAPPPPPDRSLKLDDLKNRLEGLLARHAEPPPKPAPDRAAALDSTLKALERQIDEARARIAPPAPLPPAPPPAPPEARTAATAEHDERMRRLEASLSQITSRLAEPTPPPKPTLSPEDDERVRRIEARLGEIGDRLAEPPPPPPPNPALKHVDDLSAAIAEIAARQKTLDDRADSHAMRRDQKAIADSVATLRSDVAGLIARVTAIGRADAEEQHAFHELSRRIDALAAETPVDRSMLTGIRGELDAIRAIGEGAAREQTIAARLDELQRIVPDYGRLDALGEEISAVRRSLESADGPRAISRLEMRVNELARGVDAALNSRQAAVDTAAASMTAGLAEIRRALEELTTESRETRPEPAGPALAEIRKAVDALAAESREARPEPVGPALAGLASDLAEARAGIDRIAAADPAGAISGLSGGLAEIRAAIDQLTAASRQVDPGAAVISTLSGSLIDIRTAIDELAVATRRAEPAPHAVIGPTDASVAGLAASLEEIRRAIDSRVAPVSRPDDALIERLENRLDEIALRIDGVLDRAAPVDVVNGLHDRLEALVDRLDRMTVGAPQPRVLDEIKGEIASIREEISGREPVRVDYLEDQIRDLAGRLEEVSRPDAAADQLADLEAQVTRLAGELEEAMPRSAALEQVEANLSRLQTHLSDSRHESIEAARTAARDAVREYSGGKQVDGDLLNALRGDLDRIRSASGDSDERTRETLGSLHDMLASIVDRLHRLEKAETVAAAAPAAAGADASSPAVPRSEAATVTHVTSRSSATPATRPTGSDIAALRELAPGADPARDRGAGDRRADFIAAARRAAQAAVAEAGAADREEKMPQTRPSAFARIGQAIRTRKKPLLLAAAAVVLAIGAFRVFGPPAGGESDNLVVAKVEPPVAIAPVAPVPLVRTVGESAAPTVPKVAEPALVLPAADTKTALAGPGVLAGRFGDGFDAPAADVLEPAEDSEPIDVSAAVSLDKPAAPSTDSVAPVPGAIGSDKLRTAAAAGDPVAAFEIATRYAEGRGVDQNLATAAEWYKRAAEGGVAVSQYRLGSLYERGQGVKKDLTAAVNWYQRAADQGNVGAMHNLAVLMSEGADGPPDPAKALEWFLAAGNYGVKDSQYNLGVIFARGIGRDRDLIESYKWFAVAAAQGDTDAAARRDEVGGLLSPDQLVKARAAVQAWHAKPPLPEANGVSVPEGGWDAGPDGITEADRSALVRKIQALLADQGYDPGPADGVDGPKTREAVRAFQRNLGVAETGQIDRTLVTALAKD